jgi:transaldolase
LALAGADFLVVGPKVVQELSQMPTLAGYNDGFSAAGKDDLDDVPLSPEAAKAVEFTEAELAPVTKQSFEEGLGVVGKDLLAEGLKGLVDDIDRLQPYFKQLAISNE